MAYPCLNEYKLLFVGDHKVPFLYDPRRVALNTNPTLSMKIGMFVERLKKCITERCFVRFHKIKNLGQYKLDMLKNTSVLSRLD